MSTPSIIGQPLFRPKLIREISMEQLRSAYVSFMEDLDPKGNLFESAIDDDGFHDSMWLFLEESFGWPDYHSHN